MKITKKKEHDANVSSVIRQNLKIEIRTNRNDQTINKFVQIHIGVYILVEVSFYISLHYI